MDFNRRNKFSFIALMEPFRDPSQIDNYRTRLGFTYAVANSSGKIWCFWRSEWEAEVVLDSIQQVSLLFD